MALDPSIYAQVGKGVTPLTYANPLDMYGKVATTGNALLQGRNLQQTMSAQQAIGQNVQAATNPDGTIDTGKLNTLNAQTPDAAYGAQASATTSQALSQAQQTRSIQAQQHVNQTLTSALALPDSAMTPDTVKSSLDQLRQNGSITDQDEAAALSGIPQGATPQAIRQYLIQHTVANLAGPQAVQQLFGANTTANVDGQTVPTVTKTPMMGGGVAQAPGVASGLSPGEATAPTQIGVDAKGAPIMGTRQQFIGATGGGPSPLGTGRLPTSLLNPNKPAASTGAVGTPAALAQPGVVTGLGPAQTAAASTTGATNANAFAKMQDDGTKAQMQGGILGNMLADTKAFASGQTDLNAVKGTIQKYAPGLAASLGVKPESVAANESFDKLANQIADAQGAGSDARLAVNQHANPSSSLSPQGVDLILRQLQGNADYTRARAKLAAAYPDQSDRAGFESKVGSAIDPRAFQFDRMTPAQRTTYAKSLSPTDQKAVQQSYVKAGELGLLASGWTPAPATTPPPVRGY